MRYDFRSFGRNLAAERARKRLTQEQLANLTEGEITAATIGTWERGVRYPTLDSVCCIANVLDLGLDQLVDQK